MWRIFALQSCQAAISGLFLFMFLQYLLGLMRVFRMNRRKGAGLAYPPMDCSISTPSSL